MEVDGTTTNCFLMMSGCNLPGSSSCNIVAIPALLPRIDENEAPSIASKERLISVLDQVEDHVERLRKDATRLEEEKDQLLLTLDTLRNSDIMNELDEYEKDEVMRYTERITNRCLTVDLTVRTNRDHAQEDSLHQVNALIDHLVLSAQTDWNGSRSRCEAFQNACSSLPIGPTDKSFELAVLGCTLDDQKKIKKRLQGLMDYFDKMNQKK